MFTCVVRHVIVVHLQTSRPSTPGCAMPSRAKVCYGADTCFLTSALEHWLASRGSYDIVGLLEANSVIVMHTLLKHPCYQSVACSNSSGCCSSAIVHMLFDTCLRCYPRYWSHEGHPACCIHIAFIDLLPHPDITFVELLVLAIRGSTTSLGRQLLVLGSWTASQSWRRPSRWRTPPCTYILHIHFDFRICCMCCIQHYHHIWSRWQRWSSVWISSLLMASGSSNIGKTCLWCQPAASCRSSSCRSSQLQKQQPVAEATSSQIWCCIMHCTRDKEDLEIKKSKSKKTKTRKLKNKKNEETKLKTKYTNKWTTIIKNHKWTIRIIVGSQKS